MSLLFLLLSFCALCVVLVLIVVATVLVLFPKKKPREAVFKPLELGVVQSRFICDFYEEYKKHYETIAKEGKLWIDAYLKENGYDEDDKAREFAIGYIGCRMANDKVPSNVRRYIPELITPQLENAIIYSRGVKSGENAEQWNAEKFTRPKKRIRFEDGKFFDKSKPVKSSYFNNLLRKSVRHIQQFQEDKGIHLTPVLEAKKTHAKKLSEDYMQGEGGLKDLHHSLVDLIAKYDNDDGLSKLVNDELEAEERKELRYFEVTPNSLLVLIAEEHAKKAKESA